VPKQQQHNKKKEKNIKCIINVTNDAHGGSPENEWLLGGWVTNFGMDAAPVSPANGRLPFQINARRRHMRSDRPRVYALI